MFSLNPSVVGLASPCTYWRKDTITRSCALHMTAYLRHRIGEELVFFSFLYIKPPLELGVEVAFNNRTAVTYHKVNLLKFPLWSISLGAALSTPMILLCCSFASAFFTYRNPSSLFVDSLNSKMYSICTSSLIATPSVACPRNKYRRKTLDRGCTVPLDLFCQ